MNTEAIWADRATIWGELHRARRPSTPAAPPPPQIKLGGRLGRWAWAGVVLYATAAYYAANYALPGRFDAETSLYVLQPLMWGGLAALSLGLLAVQSGFAGIAHLRVLFFASWAAGFQIGALVAVGLLYGFGFSPYAREPWHMAENGLYIAALVAGTECSRAYLVRRFKCRSPFLAIAGTTLFFGLLVIPAGNFEAINSGEAALKISGGIVLPALAASLLASYLAAIGGPAPAMVYAGGLLAFEWFSPVLPDPGWTIEGFTGTLAPLFALVTIRAAIAEVESDEETRKFDVSAPWVIATMLVVALLWFNTGLLGVQPAVVTGVSMEPTMHTGDLVILRPVDTDDLKVGDVVRFSIGRTAVMHRITEIQETTNGRVFVTQGDNNNTPDDPLLEGQIEGKVILTVPKAGWVPIKLGQALNSIR
jgi:signal peptidase